MAKRLGKHRQQASGELHTDLGLLAGRKHIHHAVHRLGSGTGVQSAEDEVTGLRGGDGQLNGFQVAHLSDQDHVGVFPQGCSECISKAASVLIELTLVHQAAIAFVNKLDRIFDGEDVFGPAVVDVIQQCGQGGCLA